MLDEIIHEEGKDDTEDAERIQWDRFEQHLDSLDESSLDEVQKVFVCFKGFYEGVYKGFYRNQEIEHRKYENECLGHDSYEALDVIVHAWDEH